MSVVVGTLTIDLKANTASFAQSMDKMSQLSAKSANDIKRSLEKITAVGLAMGAAVAAGTVAMIKGALDTADAMSKMAQAAGTTTETLSTLNYAAGLSDVSTEQLVKSMEKLSLASFKAQNGNVQLERVFTRIGVSTQDANGKLKDSGILMEELAVKFAAMGDGAGKTALAQAVFGKAGAALIPMLNQYGAEQAKVNDEAHRFGLVLGTSTAEVAAKAHDNLERLQAIMKGLGFSLLSATLPALDELLQKLVNIAQNSDLQGLARSFGGEVVKAVHLLGDALDFATQHAHALKVAMEALVAMKLATIAIPIIGDLQKGGIANVGKGLDKLTVSFLGLEKALPALSRFGTWIADSAKFVGLLATEEGIASAASYALGGAVSAMGGPIGIAIGAIVGIGIALYKFRDATFSLGGTTYQLRDIWNAAWIVMGKAFSWVGSEFMKFVNFIKGIWTGFVSWLSGNVIVNIFKSMFTGALSWVGSVLGRLTPQFAVDALNEAKRRREAAAKPTSSATPEPKSARTLPAPDTSGLSKPQKDVFGDELRKLDVAIAQQQAYLGVLDATPDKIAAVAAQEKARGIILELSNKLIDEGRLKQGQLISAAQQAAIQQRVATEESLKSVVDYGKELVGQQHSADLSIQQTRAMAAANLEGDSAIREATISNALLALSYGKSTEELKKFTEMEPQLRAMFEERASGEQVAAIDKEIYGLRAELEQRRQIAAVTLGTIDAQRQAALEGKLYTLNRDIADPGTSTAARDRMREQRDALIQLTKAENDAADAQAALSLLSPAEQLDREMDSLNHAADALRALQGGTLTYGQQLGIAARQQDEFNRATDETVNLLLREGSMGNGVTAFFLKMQEQAKTAAATIYDVLNETFNKLSQNLTDLITAPNRWKRADVLNQFGSMFSDIGKNLLNDTIKRQMQSGLGSLGKVFGVSLGSANKPDGSTSGSALWVRWAGALAAQGASTGGGIVGSAAGIAGGLLGGGGGEEAGGGAAATTQGGGGILGGIFGGLFGMNKSAGQAVVRPTFPTGRAAGAPNELTDLAASTTRTIPDALRRTAAGAVLGASLLGSPAAAPALTPSAGGNAAASESTEMSGPPLLWPGPPEAASAGAPLATVVPIQNPPAAEAKTLTQITKPQPTLFDKILGAGVNLAGSIGGSLLGGKVSSSSSGASGAWAQADQADDNTPDGIVTIPMVFGGKVSGQGSATSDSIPAMLSHGEYVINANATAKHLPLLHRINKGFASGGLIGYDDGGYVTPSAAYMPGERGTAMMASASTQMAGTAASSSPSSAGDQHTWHIDARGNQDPAQSIARLDRYMKTAGPQIAASAVHAVKDQQLRRAPSAR